MTHTTCFSTAIGTCALAWRASGIVGLLLPDTSEVALRRTMAQRWPEAQEASPSAPVTSAIDAIRQLLDGHATDLRAIRVDLTGVPEFHQRVYAATRDILPGDTRTYGALALAVGAAGGARAVGQAMARNPVPLIVPCHRVLAASGRMHGFSAPGGVITKRRLLEIEGAAMVDEAPRLFA